MIEARELHPVTFFEKGEHKPTATKDFRPRPVVNEKELEEKEEEKPDVPEEEVVPVGDLPRTDEDSLGDTPPDPAPETQARRAAKD